MKMLAAHVPSSTYRIQLNQGFRFVDALKILDYLQILGISDLYLSPVLASRKGSSHGYDVIDPSRLDPDLGTEEEFAALQNELQNRGMGLLLDIVPNHMAASAENPWWMDILENGAQSAFAAFFDVDWNSYAPGLQGRILLPILGRPFGEALDCGELKLVYNDGRFFIQYFESIFPLSPRSYYSVLNHRLETLKETLGEENGAYYEYSGILAATLELARGDRRSADSAAERRMRFESARERLRMLVNSNTGIARLIQDNIADINGKEGDPGSLGMLQRLLAEQNYKLAFWQNLNETINYRRFFTIADLVGVRVEDPIVFEATHGYILRLVARNPSAGLRIDHIDGLRDPLTYLNRLQERLATDETKSDRPNYVIVEKILARHEHLPEDWPVSGTTGYDYTNQANGVFVNPEGAHQIEEIYSNFINRRQDFADVLYQKKKLVMNTLLAVEMRTLGRHLMELASLDRYARELDGARLREALIEVTACMNVYRTYTRNMELRPEEIQYIEGALSAARARAAHISHGYFNFIREVLLLLNPPHVLPDQREMRLGFVMRWQQFTGPIVAKGFEDTALYVYHPLLSLNEVGGNPRPAEAATREEFYRFLQERQQRWPGTLDATSTHDTKRSEDVRARLNVLSEIPSEWEDHLKRWSLWNGKHKINIAGQTAPDSNEEYFFYQTLLGVWPLQESASENLLQRVQEHLIKAIREAMVHTRWTRPNEQHEDALRKFAERVICENNREFLRDFHEFHEKIAYYGMINGLSQVLLKIASPGVADFYQGSELWDLRLVDPDNRGQIDFAKSMAALKTIASESGSIGRSVRDLVTHWQDGRVKLYLIWKALNFRRAQPDLFLRSDFVPLESTGCYAENVVGFVRRTVTSSVLVAVPRWLSRIRSGGQQFDWCDTRLRLPPGSASRWNHILGPGFAAAQNGNGEPCLMADDLFRDFPVALLQS
jgi:(1->4)-alpha-D-glucan 1-alpha-D-glucosylmutase